jgi:PGF-CTERM protein
VTIESTDETETVAPGQPGFGVVAVTVALLVATLFARRRHRR